MAAAEPAANRNLEAARLQVDSKVTALQAQLAGTFRAGVPKAQRIVRIRHLTGEWSALMSPFSACRTGCSHCCHINTDVPRSEAQLIAKRTGRALKQPATRASGELSEPDRFFGVACPFLEEGGCGIYEHRPLACRALVNLADDSQLCELRPGEVVPVPYANATLWQGAFATVTAADDWADIREWF